MPYIHIKPDTAEVINGLGGTLDEPDDVIKQILFEAGHGELFDEIEGEVVIELIHQGRVEKQIRAEGDSQIPVMVSVVDYLFNEHSLAEKITFPYSPHGDSKTLLNTKPVREDGAEMKRSREVGDGYHVNVLYSKDEKVGRLRELAGRCGLGLEPAGSWAE